MLTSIPDVTENFTVTHLPQRKLTPIAVSEKVFHSVQASSKETVRLPEFSTLLTIGPTPCFNASTEGTPDEGGRRVPSLVLGGHVFLTTS